MQIREMTLKELYTVFNIVQQLHTQLNYDKFEDLIYDMRHMEYKMFGLLERNELISYAGVAIQTNLSYNRHLYIFDFVTDEKYRCRGYGTMMLEYLEDYARTAACENILFSSEIKSKEIQKFYEKKDFSKKNYIFIKSI